MALGDVLLKQLSKSADKVNDGTEPAPNKLKSKAAIIISVFAAIYSVCVFFQGTLNSTVLNNTIKANDLWAFYQAKSIKQGMAEYAQEEAAQRKDTNRVQELQKRIDKYESDLATGEGKREIMAKAKQIEVERDLAKKKAPWFGMAGSVMQIAIVLLTASILSTGMLMFWGGIATMGVALVLMAQGFLLFF